MDTTTDPAGPDGASGLIDLFEQLVTASADLAELEQPQREVWVSGLLASWRSDVVVDDPEAVDREFRAWCEASALPAAAIIAEVSENLIAGLTTSVPQAAWRIGQEGAGGAWSVVISFADPTGTEHCLLAELDDGGLADLNFAGPAAEVVPDPIEVRADMDELLRVEELTLDAAAEEVIAGWIAAAETVEAQPDLAMSRGLAPGLVMNQLAARSRLATCRPASDPGTTELALFVSAPGEPLSFTEGMADSEVAEANSWALGVLTTALRKTTRPPEPDADVVAAARGPLRGPIDHLDRSEQQALCYLEWADWLGVLIGLVRGGPGTSVDPSSMVDLINRCDEVSSTVPDEDRDYIEYAFEVALAMWTDSGIVQDGRLAQAGHAALVPAATAAWSG